MALLQIDRRDKPKGPSKLEKFATGMGILTDAAAIASNVKGFKGPKKSKLSVFDSITRV